MFFPLFQVSQYQVHAGYIKTGGASKEEFKNTSDFIGRHRATLVFYAFVKLQTAVVEAFVRDQCCAMSPNETEL